MPIRFQSSPARRGSYLRPRRCRFRGAHAACDHPRSAPDRRRRLGGHQSAAKGRRARRHAGRRTPGTGPRHPGRRRVGKRADRPPTSSTSPSTQQQSQLSSVDLVVYDRCIPKTMPQANTLFIGRLLPAGNWKGADRGRAADDHRCRPLAPYHPVARNGRAAHCVRHSTGTLPPPTC